MQLRAKNAFNRFQLHSSIEIHAPVHTSKIHWNLFIYSRHLNNRANKTAARQKHSKQCTCNLLIWHIFSPKQLMWIIRTDWIWTICLFSNRNVVLITNERAEYDKYKYHRCFAQHFFVGKQKKSKNAKRDDLSQKKRIHGHCFESRAYEHDRVERLSHLIVNGVFLMKTLN